MDKYDFSGYATKNNLLCSDGRTIIKDAFKDNDRQRVPLVWQHLRNDPNNVLGYAILEHRDDGTYAYCYCNNTDSGKAAKAIVQHGDVKTLSIYANQLKQEAGKVLHGNIREVSLVMAGANPGAVIDNININHGDGTSTELDDEAVITADATVDLPEIQQSAIEPTKVTEVEPTKVVEAEPTKQTAVDAEPIEHGDNSNMATPAADTNADPTVGEVFDTLTEVQKEVVYAIIAEAVDAATADSSVAQSDEEGEDFVNHNVFEGKNGAPVKRGLTAEEWKSIQDDAKRLGSLKDAFLQHADGDPTDPVAGVDYGVTNIDYMFPDARAVTNEPALITRRMAWVARVISGTKHTPFSRIKSLAADLTVEDARARGYVKGSMKKDEVFGLLKRTTSPTTIYKKQKLDRDDIVDITDMDVVVWLKAEMRVMLDEELARAILVSDGREPGADGKISEATGAAGVGIRSIWKDDDMYAYHVQVAADADYEDIVDDIIRARENYEGSGNPVMFTTSSALTEMLLLKAADGRRLYANQTELQLALRVSDIIEVPVMSTLSRTDDATELNLLAIIVNLQDYTIGADKGGSVNLFDDFDIDYNQYKYLMETRCSGALTLPHSAIVVEQVVEGEGA